MEALDPSWEGILRIWFLYFSMKSAIGMMLLGDTGEARIPLMSHVTSRNGCRGCDFAIEHDVDPVSVYPISSRLHLDLSCLVSIGQPV
jgi:hypothetical protein